MEILNGSDSNFNYERLQRDLESLEVPTDFSLRVCSPIKSYWGRYFVWGERINAYVAGLTYEAAFPHILHESIHHYQYVHQNGFKRLQGVMHDDVFKSLYESKLNEWELLYKNGGGTNESNQECV